MSIIRLVAPLLAASALLLTACAGAPEPEPRPPLDEPIDAFEAVGEPRMPPGNRPREGLSSDVERLQNARRLYEQEQERRAAEVQRRQRDCRAQPGSTQVEIEDGAGGKNATYCQPAGE